MDFNILYFFFLLKSLINNYFKKLKVFWKFQIFIGYKLY